MRDPFLHLIQFGTASYFWDFTTPGTLTTKVIVEIILRVPKRGFSEIFIFTWCTPKRRFFEIFIYTWCTHLALNEWSTVILKKSLIKSHVLAIRSRSLKGQKGKKNKLTDI